MELEKGVIPMARILLLGMDENLAGQLGVVLADDHHEVTAAGELDRGCADAEVIFFCGDGGQYKKHLAEARRRRPHVPFVVVTRLAETEQWLDALEDGATDYCAAPFERRQVRWILDGALRRAA